MKTETFEDLFYLELCELYDVESRLVDALAAMARASSSGRLREALIDHREQTKGHQKRIEQIFQVIGRTKDRKSAEGIRGLIEASQEIIAELEQSALRDAALIAAGNRVEHYEIASYGTVIAFAELLGHKHAAGLLTRTLEEEISADKRLTGIAVELVNREALQLGAHQHV